MKTFYEFVLTYRGAAGATGRFAEAVFNDSMFPRASTHFHEISDYVEIQGESDLNTTIFDQIWADYSAKYSL
jgi:uncharacterized protein YozE (UPF0346 family)